jgi:hypothetical protein
MRSGQGQRVAHADFVGVASRASGSIRTKDRCQTGFRVLGAAERADRAVDGGRPGARRRNPHLCGVVRADAHRSHTQRGAAVRYEGRPRRQLVHGHRRAATGVRRGTQHGPRPARAATPISGVAEPDPRRGRGGTRAQARGADRPNLPEGRPLDRLESPWLEPQGIVPQADDGVVIARGSIDGCPIVIASIEQPGPERRRRNLFGAAGFAAAGTGDRRSGRRGRLLRRREHRRGPVHPADRHSAGTHRAQRCRGHRTGSRCRGIRLVGPGTDLENPPP